MPPKPNKDADKVEALLDDNFSDEKPRGRDIIGGDEDKKTGRSRLYTWEQLRLKNESKIFWDVYYKEKEAESEGKEDPKKKATADAKIFWDVEKDAKTKLDRDKAKREAKIFWEVYYDLKKKKEPKIDTKPKTKITPVKQAITGVKDVEKKEKEEEGWFMSLLSMLTPFITGAIATIAPLLLKFAALATAIGLAIPAIWKLIDAKKEYKEAIDSYAEHARISVANSKRQIKIMEDQRQREAELAKLAEGEKKDEHTRISALAALTAKIRATELEERQKWEKEHGPETWSPGARTIGAVLGAGFSDLVSRVGIGEHSGKSISDIQQDVADAYEHEAEVTRKRSEDAAESRNAEMQALVDRIKGPFLREGALAQKFGTKEDQEYQEHEMPKKRLAELRALEKEALKEKFLKTSQFNILGTSIGATEEIFEKWLQDKKEDSVRAAKEAEALVKGVEAKDNKKEKINAGHGMGRQFRDFVSRPGMPPVNFSSHDDILGFKQGGPVSDFLRGGVALGGFQLRAINRSNDHLKTLVDLTRGLLAKRSGGGSNSVVSVPMPGRSSSGGDTTFSEAGGNPDSRADAYNAPYSLNVPPVLAS